MGEVRGVEPPELLLAVTLEPDLAAAMALARMRLMALDGAAAAAPALGVVAAPAAALGVAADGCRVWCNAPGVSVGGGVLETSGLPWGISR